MHRAKELGKIAKRCASAQAVATQQVDSRSMLSKSNNGLKIATCNHNAPAAKLVLLVKTGSRDDDASNVGLTHCLQACAGLTSAKNTAFLTTQLLSSLGADLEVTAGRDHVLYSIGCHATAAKELILDVLTPSILGSKFPWWEVRDTVVSKMRYQKAFAENDPFYVLMEGAHKASFRGNFSNPLLSPDYMVGKHTSEMLSSRFEAKFTLGNMILAGSGIHHDALCEIGSSMDSLASGASGDISSPRAKFISSEVHLDKPGDLAYASLNFKGLALNDKDTVALAVLQHALGTTCHIKHGSGVTNGIMNSALEKKMASPFSTSAFSSNYSDCGLFGITVVAPRENLSEVVSAVSMECRKLLEQGIPEDALLAGKERLKSSVCMDAESNAAVVDVAVQASILDTVTNPATLVSMIERVSSSDVASIAMRVLGGKKSLATLGQNYDGPFLQDL